LKIWCWGRLEKISWANHGRNEVLHRVEEEKDILGTIKSRNANRIGHIWHRNCFLKHVIEGKIEVAKFLEFDGGIFNIY
jgi:hypothetical protein